MASTVSIISIRSDARANDNKLDVWFSVVYFIDIDIIIVCKAKRLVNEQPRAHAPTVNWKQKQRVRNEDEDSIPSA